MLKIFSRLRFTAFVLILTILVVSRSTARGENSYIANISPGGDQDTNDNSRMDQEKKFSMDRSRALIEPLMGFTCSLFDKVRGNERNVIFSPLSIHAALNLVALGAEPGSTTDQELRRGLGYALDTTQEQLNEYHKAYKNAIATFKEVSKLGLESAQPADSDANSPRGNSRSSNEPVIDFFNSIITKSGKPIHEDYSKRSLEFYNSTVEQINPESPETIARVVDKINKWAKEAGFNQRILEGSEFSDEKFAAMLLSVVRVQAFWFDSFSENTHKGIFYNLGLKDGLVDGKRLFKSNIDANFIEFEPEEEHVDYKLHYKRVNEDLSDELRELKALKFRGIRIPLRGKVSFTILEPRAGTLEELTQKLLQPNSTRSLLAKTLNVLDSQSSRAELDFFSMPKFGFENNIDLKSSLKSLGMNRIFDNFRSELNRMIQNEPLCVDRAIHQAMIEVNKHGIKAAGVTKISLIPLSAVFHAERLIVEVKNPFIFIIRYEQMPLFIGQLVKLNN